MDLHYKQEITVGALVVIGVVLFIGGTMWLGGRSLSRAPTVAMVFPEVETLKRGSPVKVSGVVLGTVQAIAFEGFGRVVVRATLDARVRPRRDATAILTSTGLVADAQVNLNPGAAAEPLPSDAIIPGTVERGIMASATDLTARANQALAGIAEIANRRLAEDLRATLESFRRLATLYGDSTRGPSAELTRTLAELRQLRVRLDSTLTDLNLAGRMQTADSLMRNLSRLSDDARSTASRFDTLLARVNRGEGSLGQFVADTGFYYRARATLRSLQEFLDDLKKHPGKIGITVRVF